MPEGAQEASNQTQRKITILVTCCQVKSAEGRMRAAGTARTCLWRAPSVYSKSLLSMRQRRYIARDSSVRNSKASFGRATRQERSRITSSAERPTLCPTPQRVGHPGDFSQFKGCATRLRWKTSRRPRVPAPSSKRCVVDRFDKPKSAPKTTQ
jgi:hypothetical protein